MKVTKKLISGILSVSLSVTLLTGIPFNAASNCIKAKAETTSQTRAMTVLETDVETASEGCTMLGVYGSYYSQAQEALDRINEIRREACNDGNVPYPGNPSRMLSPDDYVPIKWSKDLESIARIRAVEGGLALSFLQSGHSRFNGKEIWSVQYNGVSSYAENLAYNGGNSMVYGINQWYREKSDWVNQKQGAVTGHYTSIINPKYTYTGLGDFYTEAAKYPNTLAGAFCSSSSDLDQSMQPAQANIIQKIEVKNSYITGYTLDGKNTIDKGSTTELEIKANLKNGSNTLSLWIIDPVTYTSSDDSVAQVTDTGVVTGMNDGTATITAKSGNNELASIIITIRPSQTPSPSPTVQPAQTPTPSPTIKPTPSATPVVTPTPVPAASASPSVKPSQTPAPAPSATSGQNQGGGNPPANNPAQAPTASPSPTVKPSQTPTVSPSPTVKPSQTPTASPSPTVKPSQTPTVSPSPTVKPSQTPAASTSPTAKPSQKPAASTSPTVRPTQKPAVTLPPVQTPLQTQAPVTADVENPDKGYEKPSGINVKYHTQEEIRNYAKNSNISLNDAISFDEEPVTKSPYSLGKLSSKTLNAAIKTLNQVRYIAGISDNVELSDKYNTLCQAAAVANYANNQLSHFPKKPDGMSDDLYELATEGASSSNIAWASWSGRSLNSTIISSWMEDGDSSNIDRVGHRRWLINPYMGKTGFGVASGKNGTYSTVYSFDESNHSAEEYGVAWPAQNMPVQYFNEYCPWSVSMGYTVNKKDVKVTLTRKSDGKTWHFKDSSSDGAFYVDNAGYGQTGCIIFRPDNIKNYKKGDLFKVEISGLKENVSYTVNFFDLNASSGKDDDSQTNTIKKGTKVTNSNAIYKVTGTGSSKTAEYEKNKNQNTTNIVIPDSININGVKYKVTSIGKNAFKNNKKLKSVTINKNIASIGEKAFYGCKKLSNITVKTNNLTAGNIGKKAFSKGYSKPQVKADKSKLTLYKKIFKSKGMSKKCKFKAL